MGELAEDQRGAQPTPWPTTGRSAVAGRGRGARGSGRAAWRRANATRAPAAAISAAAAPAQQAGARAERLGEPAHERRADRRRAEEDDRVERHHAPAHGRLDGELQGRVHPAANVTLAAPSGSSARICSGSVGASGREQLGRAERERGADQQPRR